MRVAFYAPMKPPDHPVPSGDRRMARLLIEALGLAGHEVELASHLRSRDGTCNPARQTRIKELGGALARRLIRRYQARPPSERPEVWLTYHLYYKAPDWIGPEVSAALGIPYLVAEASVAPKRAGGHWDLGHRATLSALARAAAVVTLNPDDAGCLPDPARVRPLKPFLDPAPYRAAARQRDRHRAALTERLALDPAQPWLLTVAMMRPGDKLRSYETLALALGRPELQALPWQLVVAGDGPARREVRNLFAMAAPCRYRFAGQLDSDQLPGFYGASDLFVWPAVKEAYGLALLEAQASGLPAVAGRSGGVPQIVRHGETGLLVDPASPVELAGAVAELISNPERRHKMAARALAAVQAGHSLSAAARQLDAILKEALGTC
jgi:glycosyltransferase involved in cell wall biosynthesis